jgi:hypothetical protein
MFVVWPHGPARLLVTIYTSCPTTYITCRGEDQKDFDQEIKKKHDLMLSEYPQEFITSILKPSHVSMYFQKKHTTAQSLSHALRVSLRN